MKPRKKRRAMNIELIPPLFSQKEKLADILCGILLSVMLFFSVGGMLLNMFSISAIGILPTLCAAAVITAYFLLKDWPVKNQLKALGCLFGADIAAWLIAFKYARAGFYSVINHITAVFDTEAMQVNFLFETNVTPNMETGCVTLFLSLIAPVFALICAWLIQNCFKLAGGFILAAVALLAIMESVNHSGLWSGILCVTIALIIIRSLISSDSLSAMPVVCAVIMCGFLTGAAVMLLFAGDVITELGQKLDTKRYSISRNIHKMRFEKESVIKDDDGDIEVLMMPEGDFYKIRKELSPSFETTLDITMSDCDEVQSVYLRGYVGEVYTENGWRPLPKKTLGEYSSLFYQLHKNGFYPQTQLALISDILDGEINKDSLIPVEVNIETACKGFVYAPYELYSANSSLLRENSLDQAHLGNSHNGLDNYSYNILPNQVKRYSKLDKMLTEQMNNPSERLSEYLAMESKYRSFVYSNYTEISEEHKKFLSGFIGEPGVAGQTHISYDDARKNIFKVMADVMEYEEEVEQFNGKSSFLRFVLRELQYGYAPHYATATVMMLRHYGIPARYVEGYVITPDDAESTEPGDELSVTDYSAHAWAEYYHDGLGWLPLDTSPNFANIMEGTGAPPEYMYEMPSESMEEQEEEIPPVYNKNRHEKEEPEIDEIMTRAFPWIIFVIVLLLLLLGWWYIRKKILQKRRAAFDDADNNAAVCAMMRYMNLLLEVCSIKSHHNTHTALVEAVSENWGDEWEKNFGQATQVFQKAAYSQHTVNAKERATVKETMTAMLAMVDSLQNRRSRFKLKFIKFLY